MSDTLLKGQAKQHRQRYHHPAGQVKEGYSRRERGP